MKVTTKASLVRPEVDAAVLQGNSATRPVPCAIEAGIVHLGQSATSGHYVLVVHHANGTWVRMDAAQATVISESEALVMLEVATVLLLHRTARW